MHLIHCNPAGEKTHICLVSKRSGLFPAGDTSQGIRCTTHQQKVHIGYIEHIALQLLHPEIAFYNHGALLMISCYFKNFATSYIGYTSETTAPQFWNQSYSYEKLDFLWSTWRQLHGPAPLPDTHVTVLPHFLTRLCLYFPPTKWFTPGEFSADSRTNRTTLSPPLLSTELS